MKRSLFVMLSFMVTLIMMAGNVTPEQARRQAAEFMKNHLTTGGHNRAAAKPIQMTLQGQIEGLYLFNLEENNGFVIVSNDDRTDAILGFSDSGSLDPENMPDNMRAWLQGYEDQIKWMDEHGVTAKASRRAPVKKDISPLVETTWNQEEPYNNLCPEFLTTGNRCVTGCVATAMAQVLYYTYRTKNGESSSYTSGAIAAYDCDTHWNGSNQVHVDAVPDNTALNWSSMLNDYSGSSYESSNANAVATLMKACGASVHMDYANKASGGSSASSSDVPYALKTYFGCKATTQYVSRSFYSYINWIEMLYNELQQGRPVFYSGRSSGGGHAFVCDGYLHEDFFHINWGWGGKSDGFFKLSALNPDEQGAGGSTSTDGYNFGQGAVVGIQSPSETGTILSNPNTVDLTLNSVSADAASVAKDGSVNITFNITNNSAQVYDGEIGLWFSNFSIKVGQGKMFIIPAGATQDCVVEFKPTSNMSVGGPYRITAYKPKDNGKYETINNLKYVDINITAGSTPTTTSTNLDLTTSLKSIENANVGMTYVYCNASEKTIKAVITVTNPSTEANYKGQFGVCLRSASSYSYVEKVITVPANGSYDFTFSSDGVIGREYYFTTIYNKSGAFTAEANVGGNFTLKNGVFVNCADGTKTVMEATGTYNAPDNALSVNFTGAEASLTVNPSTNPNCLYIINSDKSVAGLTNVIKYNSATGVYTADNIVLTDGYDFASPVDFTATSIEFTYNNDRWADGAKGWNTIMLPFDVSQVTAGGTDIDWFRNGTDHNKQFWLKEFVSDGAGTVSFDHASTMKANTPYIIALPGDHWGAAYNLSVKTIKFIGSGQIKKSEQAVTTGSSYRFIGNTKSVTTANIYCINGEGSQFTLKTSGGSPAFRPFFKADMFDRSVGSLSIGSGGGTTGITLPELPKDFQSDKIFDLNGRQLTKPAKGIVIQNGRKVVKK